MVAYMEIGSGMPGCRFDPHRRFRAWLRTILLYKARGATMFTQNDLLHLMNARPFTAFRLHMSDGGHVDVISPESVAVAVGRRTAVICFLEEDDRWQMVYY